MTKRLIVLTGRQFRTGTGMRIAFLAGVVAGATGRTLIVDQKAVNFATAQDLARLLGRETYAVDRSKFDERAYGISLAVLANPEAVAAGLDVSDFSTYVVFDRYRHNSKIMAAVLEKVGRGLVAETIP